MGIYTTAEIVTESYGIPSSIVMAAALFYIITDIANMYQRFN
jgi:hypothetical protein